MGINCFMSACSHDSNSAQVITETEYVYVEKKVPVDGNPNPRNFKIRAHRQINHLTVVAVNYPDCRNFEGDKILVFENTSIKELRLLKFLDPHFCDSNEHLSPIARFSPTKKGWGYAVSFCSNC